MESSQVTNDKNYFILYTIEKTETAPLWVERSIKTYKYTKTEFKILA